MFFVPPFAALVNAFFCLFAGVAVVRQFRDLIFAVQDFRDSFFDSLFVQVEREKFGYRAVQEKTMPALQDAAFTEHDPFAELGGE